MTAHFSLCTDLVSRYDFYLKMISFEDPAPVGSTFFQAPKCNRRNPDILDKQSIQHPIPTFMFVEDCLLATVTSICVTFCAVAYMLSSSYWDSLILPCNSAPLP